MSQTVSWQAQVSASAKSETKTLAVLASDHNFVCSVDSGVNSKVEYRISRKDGTGTSFELKSGEQRADYGIQVIVVVSQARVASPAETVTGKIVIEK